MADAQERYGKNLFEISLPAFMDLYKQQLVSPFTVFQLFCVILWCLDSYWQYSVGRWVGGWVGGSVLSLLLCVRLDLLVCVSMCSFHLPTHPPLQVFTLFMIFSFEASVVMQRIKNLNVLKGMDNKVGEQPTHSPTHPPTFTSVIPPSDPHTHPSILYKPSIPPTHPPTHPPTQVIDVLVYRSRQWQLTQTTELAPGDVFSLNRTKENDIIPCDCLLLRGSAVVNEATLTGESIPQMKDAVHCGSKEEEGGGGGGGGGGERLDLKSGTGKVHVFFGGTRLLQVSAGGGGSGGGGGGGSSTEVLDDQERAEEGEGPIHPPTSSEEEEEEEEEKVDKDAIPPPPDAGCICYALRTGFSSSQGKLVRMIESSTEGVRTDTRDTALLLLLLLVFAVAASGYVLKKVRRTLLPTPPPTHFIHPPTHPPTHFIHPPPHPPTSSTHPNTGHGSRRQVQVPAPPPLCPHHHLRHPARTPHANGPRRQQVKLFPPTHPPTSMLLYLTHPPIHHTQTQSPTAPFSPS